ncbi:MAG: hypothetical protein OXB99_03560 [Acidimicrobiaceae bacterium]|nr:hypothetical protein [Acidimicrobiaceae bacterium]
MSRLIAFVVLALVVAGCSQPCAACDEARNEMWEISSVVAKELPDGDGCADWRTVATGHRLYRDDRQQILDGIREPADIDMTIARSYSLAHDTSLERALSRTVAESIERTEERLRWIEDAEDEACG